MPKARPAAIEIRAGSGGESAYVGKTRIRVSDIARLYLLIQDEIIAERIVKAYPHLTMDQVEAAFDYWRSHQDEINAEIQEEEGLLAQLQSV